jgi:hypothetical protein
MEPIMGRFRPAGVGQDGSACIGSSIALRIRDPGDGDLPLVNALKAKF